MKRILNEVSLWVDDWGHTVNMLFPKKFGNNLIKLNITETELLIERLQYQLKIAKELDKCWIEDRSGIESIMEVDDSETSKHSS